MKIGLMIITICLAFLTTGCWDRVELNERSMTLASGLDIDPITGETILMYQVVKTKSGQQNDQGDNSSTDIVVGRGRTIFEARQNITGNLIEDQVWFITK